VDLPGAVDQYAGLGAANHGGGRAHRGERVDEPGDRRCKEFDQLQLALRCRCAVGLVETEKPKEPVRDRFRCGDGGPIVGS
jgi:hypothetical protein